MRHGDHATKPVIYISPRPPHGRQDDQVRALLQYALGEEEVAIAHTEEGAPYLTSHPELSLSISHCLSAVAVALTPSAMQVGIDVEDKVLQSERILDRYSSDVERQELARADISSILLWSAKESLYKAYSTEIRHFTKDIRLTTVRAEERSMSFDLDMTKGGLRRGLEVRWIVAGGDDGILGSTYEDGLVLTYHLSRAMEEVEIISV